MKVSAAPFSRGLSIIEVLVGIFLIGIVSVAVLGLVTLGTRLSLESERQTVAQALVNDRIEYVRSLHYDQVGYTDAADAEADGLLTRSETVTRNQQAYDVTVNVELVDAPENGTLPAGGFTEANADYKVVTVDAVWESAGGNQRNVMVTTYIAAGVNLQSCTPGQNSCPDGSACPANGVCLPPAAQPTCPDEAYFCGGEATDLRYITTIDEIFAYAPGEALQFVSTYSVPFSYTGEGVLDIAKSASGELYAITDYAGDPSQPTNLYRVNPTTGQTTFVAQVDNTSDDEYVAAEFLADGRLAIGGPQHMKFITLENGAVTTIEDLDLDYGDTTVYFSGDLIQRGDSIMFIGYEPATSSANYCYEADPVTGEVERTSVLSVGENVWGMICEDEACDTLRLFYGSGITKLVDADSCAGTVNESFGYQWEGATR